MNQLLTNKIFIASTAIIGGLMALLYYTSHSWCQPQYGSAIIACSSTIRDNYGLSLAVGAILMLSLALLPPTFRLRRPLGYLAFLYFLFQIIITAGYAYTDQEYADGATSIVTIPVFMFMVIGLQSAKLNIKNSTGEPIGWGRIALAFSVCLIPGFIGIMGLLFAADSYRGIGVTLPFFALIIFTIALGYWVIRRK